MVLVSDAFEHIGLIYSPLNLANMKIQKLKLVWNTAPDNQQVLNFMCHPDWRIFLLTIFLRSPFCVVDHLPENIELEKIELFP